jgi:hypothetical protein
MVILPVSPALEKWFQPAQPSPPMRPLHLAAPLCRGGGARHRLADGMPVAPYDTNFQLDAVARYNERLRAANAPPLPVVEVAPEAPAKSKRVTEIKRASDFLVRVLNDGPLAEKEVMRQARLENLSEKTVKRARSKMKVKATKKGRGGWLLSMAGAPQRFSLE